MICGMINKLFLRMQFVPGRYQFVFARPNRKLLRRFRCRDEDSDDSSFVAMIEKTLKVDVVDALYRESLLDDTKKLIVIELGTNDKPTVYDDASALNATLGRLKELCQQEKNGAHCESIFPMNVDGSAEGGCLV